MKLTVDGKQEPALLVESLPFAFSGEAEVQADCLGGETLDLNMMSRRGRFVHRMTKIVVSDARTLSVTADTVAVVFRDEAVVAIDSLRSDVGLGDGLVGLDGPLELAVEPRGSGCMLYIIEVTAVSAETPHAEQVA